MRRLYAVILSTYSHSLHRVAEDQSLHILYYQASSYQNHRLQVAARKHVQQRISDVQGDSLDSEPHHSRQTTLIGLILSPPPSLPSPASLHTASPMADTLTDDLTPKFAPFLGMAGVAFAMIFGCMSSYHASRLWRTHTSRSTY